MYDIPQTILIDNKEFAIRNKGDYRMVLDCLMALDDSELSKQERILSALIIFYEDINGVDDLDKFPSVEEAFKKMCDFFNCNQSESSNSNNYKLIDWEQDSQLVCSAVNNVAKLEIRSVPYLHWWTFMGYYMSAGESLLGTVVNIRNKLVKGNSLEKYEREFKRSNPQYFVWKSKNAEQALLDEEVKKLWNSGK